MQKFKSVEDLINQLKPEKPVYCIRKKSIESSVKFFLDKFPGKILYAVKTNPHPEVIQAESVQKGVESVKSKKPGFAVVDLRLGDGNGLEVVKEIQSSNNDSRIIMLTGYGNIPTAVAAIKEGAIDYLAKPADAEDVEKALLADPAKKAAPPENPMSADRVKWNTFIGYLSCATEMYLKLQED